MATYTVTGGAGFIGSNIVAELVRRGENVRVIDNFATGRRENIEPLASSITLYEGSITDFGLCMDACRGADYVLHQAALPSVPRSVIDPIASNDANVSGTVNMLHASVKSGVNRFVYAASSSAYGNTPALPKHEDMPENPMSPYAASKLAGEHYAKAFFHCYGLETVSLRYFNIYGPAQDPWSQYGAVIPIFCRKLLAGESPEIHGDGLQTRDFTFVADAVNANLLSCEAGAGCAGQVMNVGAGGNTSVLDLFSKLAELLGQGDIRPVHTPTRPGDVRDSFAALEKAGKLIGYAPQYDIDRGLSLAIEYYKKVCS